MPSSQSIGNLNATITANASQFIQAFNEATDAVDRAVAKIDTGMSTVGTKVEAIGLRVLVGARIFQEMHREILRVVEDIDRIPGMPAQVVASIQEAKTEFQAFRAELDVFIGKAIAFGVDFGHAIGAGAAMLMGSSADDVASGLASHGTGREQMDEAARAQDINYHEKIIEAEHRLAEAKALVNLKEEDRVGKIRMLTEEAARLETISRSNSITTLKSIQDEIDAQKKLAEAAAIRQSMLKESASLDERITAEESRIWLATIPAKERLNTLHREELELKRAINEFHGNEASRAKSPEDMEKIISLRKRLLETERQEAPLLAAQQKIWDDMGEKVSGTIQSMIVNGDKLRDSFKKIMKEIEGDMLKTLIDGPLKQFFSGALKSVFGGGGFLSGVGKLFGFAAGGGNIDGPTLVGENGPEMFVPSGSGLVMNADSTRAMSGGGKGGDVYHIDARGADRAGLARLEATIKQLNGSIESRAIAAQIAFQRRTTPSYNTA